MAGGDRLWRLMPYVPRAVMRHFGAPGAAAVQEVDATLVFVDISGFTKLSERLQRKGREGAECLAEAIGQSFTALLAVAYANGGNLLKFGGDALLLLFQDEGHAARGCRAAQGMQRELRTAGRIETAGARVVLRMSAGVHTGRPALFLVGGSHRELLVAGPEATTVVRMEEAAAAGQVVVSPATAACLGRSYTGAPAGPGLLLRGLPGEGDRAPVEPELVPEAELLAGTLSPDVRAHVEQGAQAPEHRTAGVAFLHVGGLDDLVSAQGVDAGAQALREVVAAVGTAADEQGVCMLGSDVAPGGPKLLLAGGAPRARGDDEERLLLAVRRAVDAVAGGTLTLRAGVHRGPVFAGDIGPAYRRTYTVMGDTVNLAARLMARAAPGEIVATPALVERSATAFATEALAPFAVKGKAQPVRAVLVGACEGRSARTAAGRAPLLGRDRELADLTAVLGAAMRGEGGQAVEITGEAGIGKTRLLEELRGRAAGCLVVRAPCEPYAASTPYALWRRLLAPLVGEDLRGCVEEHAPSLLPWLPLLALPLGVEVPSTPEVDDLAPTFRATRLREVGVELAERLLARPALLVVEDAEHADAASAELLGALAARMSSTRALLVMTRRDGALPTDALVVRVALEPLEPEANLALAEALTADAPLPPALVRGAAARAAGNPERLADLLQAVAAGGGLPDGIEAAATARLDVLAPSDRALLRRASVLGMGFDPALLPVVLEDAVPVPDAATWARLAEIVEVRPGEVRFRRPLLREVAYAGLPFGLRRRLHAAAARRLASDAGPDGGEVAGILSLHHLLAGDFEAAWRCARAAGDRARERFAPADAAYLYRRALEAARALSLEGPEVAAVWAALGEVRERTGQPEDAARALTNARRLTGDDCLGQARLLHRHALLTMDAGGTTAAVRWALRGLRAAERASGREAQACRALLTATLATIRQRQGRMDEAIVLARRAITDAEAAGEDRALARACFVLDWALVESGRAAEAGYSEHALTILRRLGDLQAESIVLNNMGGFAFRDGRWDDAIALWQQAAELSARSGDDVNVAFGAINVGELESDAGRYEAGERELRRALRLFRATGHAWGTVAAEALLGRLEVRAGRVEEGAARLRASLAGFGRLATHQDVARVRALLAEAALAAGDPGEALNRADALLGEAPGAWLVPLLRRVRGVALAVLGEPVAAREALEAAVACARAQGEHLELALSLDALDALDPEAERRREERDAITERLGIAALPQVLRPAPAAVAA